MALGRQGERQADLMIGWAELPRSPGHAFYDRLQTVLVEAGFDRFAESECAPYYASKRGRPSLPPGRYFRMHLVGYFEGIDSERGLEWRCADSLSLREFLRLGTTEPVPDHSWLSKTRSRLPLEVHEAVFAWVLERLADHGLVKGDRIGVDASTMEANAALRAIVRRADGEGYREMLERLAKESGIATTTAEDLVRARREREGRAAVERRVGLADRPGGADRQAEGRPHPSRLRARARGRPGHRGDRRRRGAVARLVGIGGGVVSGLPNPNEPGAGAPGRRPRHGQPYHEAGCRAARGRSGCCSVRRLVRPDRGGIAGSGPRVHRDDDLERAGRGSRPGALCAPAGRGRGR